MTTFVVLIVLALRRRRLVVQLLGRIATCTTSCSFESESTATRKCSLSSKLDLARLNAAHKGK